MDLNSRTYQKANNIPNLFKQEIVRTKDYPKIFAKFANTIIYDMIDKVNIL